MKSKVRNMLWLMMIAWCFFLNDYEILGMLVAITIGGYGLYKISINNYWRVISLFLIVNTLSYLTLSKSNLNQIYTLLFPYLTVMNLDTILMNEICLKLKKEPLTLLFFMTTVVMVAFYIVILILPSISFLPYYKTNLVYLTTYLFFPSFLTFGFNCLRFRLTSLPRRQYTN